MSKWFPNVDDHNGADAALKGGFYGALAFAAMVVLGSALLIFSGRTPDLNRPVGGIAGPLIGMMIELALVLIGAWRFKIGKGLVWGPLILVLFVAEIATKVIGGTTNVGWMFFYAGVGAGLINGIRGAWAKKHLPEDDYAEVFE